MTLEIAVETLRAWHPPPAPPWDQDIDIADTIREAYLAAYLFIGCSERAESAVLEAVEAWHPEKQSKRELFMLALKTAAILSRTGSAAANGFALPARLEAVTRLPRELRKAYVLRFLAGFSREASAELLGFLAPGWMCTLAPR